MEICNVLKVGVVEAVSLPEPSTGSEPIIGPVTRTMNIARYILIVIAILIAMYAIYTYIKYKKTIKGTNGDKDKVKKEKIKIIVSFILSFLTFFASEVLRILASTYLMKPIIYLYPKSDKEKIRVKLDKPENLTCTYPKYKNEWNIVANRNGDIFDEKTGKKYYALYWEGKDKNKVEFKDGFVVKGEDSAQFLEEKLEILGLNERESEEFIVYWLPILERNKYNLIRFQTKEEIEKGMGLNITPKPDTIIRIMMTFKPLKTRIEIPEQKLEKIERQGFTVVEWGGIK